MQLTVVVFSDLAVPVVLKKINLFNCFPSDF